MDDFEPMKNEDDTLVIQHDWHLGLKEPISEFFIGVKRSDLTQYFDVKITKLVDEYGFAVMPGDGNIKSSDFSDILLDENRNLHITFQGKTTIFVSPKKQQKIAELGSAPQKMDVSPSGATFLIADSSGKFVVTNAKNSEVLRTLTGHAMDVYCCKFFQNGLLAISGGMDMSIRIWSVDQEKTARTYSGHSGPITGIAIVGNGREFISCSKDGTTRLWRSSDSEILNSWKFGKGKCVNVEISNDSSRFGVILEEKSLSVIDLHGEKTQRDFSLPSIPTSICFSDDEEGKVCFVGTEDGRILAFEVSKNRKIGEIEASRHGSVSCVKYLSNRVFVAFSSGRVVAYHIPSLDEIISKNSENSNSIAAEFELTGADCDPIYDMVIWKNNGNSSKKVFTCCRDGFIREYEISFIQ